MTLRHRSPSVRLFYRIGLSVMLAGAAEGPVFDKLIPAAQAQEEAPPIVIDASPVALVVAGEEEAEASAARNGMPDEPHPLGGRLLALAAHELDEIRGGFELADTNLKLSFGIERAVFINGELIASTVLNVKDLQGAAGGSNLPTGLPSTSSAALNVIQNGSGNHFTAQLGSDQAAATVIQNTLNNQKIQNVTTINASVNSAQFLRSLSVQSAIRDGIVSSLRH